MIDASRQTRESFRWVTHSAQVIEATNEALGELSDAESGQRGFVLTHAAIFARPVEGRIVRARGKIAYVVALTIDNPVQNVRARELQRLFDRRIAVLRPPLQLGTTGDFDAAARVIASGRGRELMAAVAMRSRVFLNEERALQSQRTDAASRRLAWVRNLALVGGPLLALLVALVSLMIARGITRPLGLMKQAMTKLGQGDRRARITATMGSREFANLAAGYNAMAEHLETAIADQMDSEGRLQQANDELRRNGDTLRERGEAIELLGRHGAPDAGRAHRRRTRADHPRLRAARAAGLSGRAVRA